MRKTAGLYKHHAELLQNRLIGFCRLLRSEGMQVTPAQTLDAVRAISLIDFEDRDTFYCALRAVLVKRPEQFEAFERTFAEYWEGAKHGKLRFAKAKQTPVQAVGGDGADLNAPFSGGTATQKDESEAGSEPVKGATFQDALVAMYSPSESLGKKRFAKVDLRDVPEMKRCVRRLARRFATRPGRRFVPSRRGPLDFRRTLRADLAAGGELIKLRRRERATSRARLLVMCDISGSMDRYSEKLLKILHVAQNSVPSTKVYAFSTQLAEMGRHLRGKSILSAIESVSQNVNIWSSGTRIGSAIGRLLSNHQASLHLDTVLIIISDGWEVGDIDLLTSNLQRVRRRVGKMIWLNPLADSRDYSPSTLGMKAALPYIDVLAGLNVLSNRIEFERTIGGIRGGAAQLNRQQMPQ